jgi:hypothetical protein
MTSYMAMDGNTGHALQLDGKFGKITVDGDTYEVFVSLHDGIVDPKRCAARICTGIVVIALIW